MDWQDEAVVLSVRQYGENARIATLLTEEHGRHAGLVRGSGAGRGGSIQTGQIVRAGWRARLSEHLGNWQIEPPSHPSAMMLDDPARLAALSAVGGLGAATLPGAEPHSIGREALRGTSGKDRK